MKVPMVLAVVALVAGCGGNEAKTFNTPADPDKAASSSPAQHAPNVADKALKLGKTRHGEGFDTTLEKVQFPYPPGEYRVPDKAEDDWLGLLIRECMHKDAKSSDDSTSSYNGDWAALSADGFDYSGDGSSWSDWPSPKFPEGVGMIPGRCVKGWIAFELPRDTKVSRIQFRPGNTPVAEWIP